MTAAARFLPRADLDRLIAVLAQDGRRVIGPTAVDGAIVHDRIGSASELPIGWTAETAPGRRRTESSN